MIRLTDYHDIHGMPFLLRTTEMHVNQKKRYLQRKGNYRQSGSAQKCLVQNPKDNL